MKYVWRVETDYLAKEYDDRICQTSSPYESREEAEKAYKERCKEFCIDDKSKPAFVQLVVVEFPDDPTAWATGMHVIKHN